MTDKFEKVKAEVKIADVVERFGVKLDRNDKGLCPFHHEKTPSFSVDRKNNIFTCFGCGETGDVITFVAKIKGVEPIEAVKILAEEFRVDIEEKPTARKLTIKEYIRRCLTDIEKTDYFTKRGLTKPTIRKFCLGYDEYRKAVVIPYSSKMEYYQTRGTEDKVFFKPRTEDAGEEPLFNIEGLKLCTREPIFVVESPICAMSIYQCGGNAVSTCGTGGWRKLIAEVKKKKPNGAFILCMDNDEPGKKASQILAEEFAALGVNAMEYNIAGDKKDPNELLMSDPKKLEANVKEAKKIALEKFASSKDSFDAFWLQGADIPPPLWIVNNVLPQGLALLCAPSKAGKSWMVFDMALAVARGKNFLDFTTNKCGVLYYALEDSKYRLKERMMKLLKKDTAPSNLRFITRTETIDCGFFDLLKEEIKAHKDIKLVIVDTLQKVRGKALSNETLYGGEYREMGEVKELCDDLGICLMFVHHTRKQLDENDVFNMISGSTALMGAADTIIVISKKRKDEYATLTMTGRDIKQDDLVIAFDEMEWRWQIKGTAEEMAAKKERQEYEQNPIVITIKELVKRNPLTGWKGSANDLLKAVFDITGKQVPDSPTTVGRLISNYEYKLHCDGIDHKASKSGTRAHTFKKILKDINFGYQRTMYDGDDD